MSSHLTHIQLYLPDDLKIFSDEPMQSSSSDPLKCASILLQNTLIIISSWSSTWQLPISHSKCSVLSISCTKSPTARYYFLDLTALPQVSSCLDLGILVDDKLSFSCHISSITKKAYARSVLISRCFLSKNCSLLTKAFTSYVRPLTEYCTPIWSPHHDKHITLIENVQRRFSKRVSFLRTMSYPARLSHLGLTSLQLKRAQTDLFVCFKILNSLFHLPPDLFFTVRSYNSTRGHERMLTLPIVHTDTCKYSFFSRVIPVWNSLPQIIVSTNSISAFKARILRSHLPDL